MPYHGGKYIHVLCIHAYLSLAVYLVGILTIQAQWPITKVIRFGGWAIATITRHNIYTEPPVFNTGAITVDG